MLLLSMYATGVAKYCRGKCAPIWSIASSPGSAGESVPDDRTMGNLVASAGAGGYRKLHRRVVEIAQENKIATGRKMRVDTTVVETDIHYPTDNTLLGDGVRVRRAS